MAATGARPRIGVIKMASCDGCQLTLLDLENELLALTERFEIVEFAEASSSRSTGPYDVCLVEGSISTPEQAEQIVELRRQSKALVAIGACATSGGIQALRNWGDHDEFRSYVYAHPEYIESLATAVPVGEYVRVDAELRGCPIDAHQLVELLTALNIGRRPWLPDEAVCLECKRSGTVCVAVAGRTPCMGPLTLTGCGALCPSYNRGCYACFGPRDQANASSLTCWLVSGGQMPTDVGRLFAGFTAYSEPFRSLVTELGGVAGTTNGTGSQGTVGAPSVRSGAQASSCMREPGGRDATR